MMKTLQGKKGGDSGRSPVKTPDNLRSKDVLELILAISEGPIAHLEDGAKSFSIGDTALQNDNGDFNFETFRLDAHTGVDTASPIQLTLAGTSQNFGVSLQLGSNVPVVRQTSTGQLDAIEVRLNIGQLFKTNDEGTFNHSLSFKLEYKALSDPGWTNFYDDEIITIWGKTTSTYLKEYRLEVDRILEPYEIRVTKLNAENTTELVSTVAWDGFQEVIQEKPTYNDLALIHLVGQSTDQFASLPQFKGVYKGLLIKIPSNYDPETKIYTGIWDGTFNIAWTDNPAWILYDFITNDRYGMRAYYPDVDMDRYDVYEAGKWCDELVPNGKGGTHARYTFNSLISEVRSGKALAKYIAGAFNATIYDDLNGKAHLRVDKDEDALHLFTEENIFTPGFTYSYVDISARFNDITVTFNNPDLNWEEDRRRVFDQDAIDKHGLITHNFAAVGCTNAQEAIRRAQYKLITSNTETTMVDFSTNRQGQFVDVFDVILVSDPDMGFGISGRILTVAGDGLSVTLRDSVYIEVGVSYDLELTLQDGGTITKSLITGHAIGDQTTLTLADALVVADIPEQAVFALQNSNTIGLPKPFRVMSVKEIEGSVDKYHISALSINRNKWTDSDNVTSSGDAVYSSLPDSTNPPGPDSVAFSERYIKKLKQFQIVVGPVFPRATYKYYKNNNSFEVWSRPNGTNEPYVQRDLLFQDTLVDHPFGLFDFKILGVSFLGFTSDIATVGNYIFDVTNPEDPPQDIDWIKINQKEVYWGYENPPDDFAGFELRYHNETGVTTWDDAIKPHEGLLTHTSFYTNLIPGSAQTIMVKAIDDFGVGSINSKNILKTSEDILGQNILEQLDYHTGSIDPLMYSGTDVNLFYISPDSTAMYTGVFEGVKDNCSSVGAELVVDDPGGLIYSGVDTNEMYNGGDFYETLFTTAYYYPTFSVTSPGRFYVIMDSDNNGFQLDLREVGETSWSAIPVTFDITTGDYELRLTLLGGKIQGVVRTMSSFVDVVDIDEVIEDLVIPAVATRIATVKTYSTIKVVSVILQNTGGATAVSYRVIDKNAILGPQIELLDSSGSVTSGTIDVIIKGY